MAKDKYKTKLERARERVNSIKFEINLWKKVKLVIEPDGTKKAINGEYRDDPLFPSLHVRGFNELNKCEEEYNLPCYVIISDWSASDWEEEYKETGESPAYSFPSGVENLLFCHINDREIDLKNAEEELIGEIKLAEQRENDKAKYYLIGETLAGKRDEGKDYLFMDAEWTLDEEGLIKKLLNGEDLTKQDFKTFDPGIVEYINTISEVERERAMEIITDQTVTHLLIEWSEKYSEEKTAWDKSPQWFSKLVSVHFTMNGIHKTLYPKDFIFADGQPDDAFIEYIGEKISEDIRKYGGFVTGIDGMMD